MQQAAVTELLHDWRGGDGTAFERLIPLVYAELRKAAHRCLRDERHEVALQTAELVNETYLRLLRSSSQVQWRDRSHFFALATQLMRRVLVDEARRRRFQKRGGGCMQVTLQDDLPAAEQDVDLLALDEALERLAVFSARKARVVELRFFGGLTIEETAAALGVSTDVVKREWRTAKLWLLHAFGQAGNGSAALAAD